MAIVQRCRRRFCGPWQTRILAGWIAIVLFCTTAQSQDGFIQSLVPTNFIQQAVPAKQLNCEIEPGDQLWVISTRDLVVDPCSGQLKVARYETCGFQPRTIDDLAVEVQAAPEIPTVVYVHGNFTDLGWSLQRGCEVYREMFGGKSCRSPVRFVIWSWKTEREAGPVVDFSVKVQRSVDEGARLIEVLNRIQIDRPVVVGYSLGCQVVLSSLTQPNQSPLSIWRIGLIAPALECHFDEQLCCHPLQPDQVGKLVVFTNQKDRALRYAGLRCKFQRCGESPFDQQTMIPYLSLGGVQPAVWNISNEVGRKHSIGQYISSATIVNVLRQMIEQAPSIATVAVETAEVVAETGLQPESVVVPVIPIDSK